MKIVLQKDSIDCGPACLVMIFGEYGIEVELDDITELADPSDQGTNLFTLSAIAEKFGFSTNCTSLDFIQLTLHAKLPAIVFWQQKHFIVVESIFEDRVRVIDPSFGRITYTKDDFISGWLLSKELDEGIALLISRPQKEITNVENSNESKRKSSILSLFHLVNSHRKVFLLSFLSLCFGLVFQLIIPVFTKNAIDVGLKNWDISIVFVLLFSQLLLILGRIVANYVSSIQILYLSTVVNISVLFLFFNRLFKFPVSYIERRKPSDLLVRINDTSRIEVFFSKVLLQGFFSVFTFLFLFLLMLKTNIFAGLVYLLFAILQVLWTNKYANSLSLMDYKNFENVRQNQSHVLQSVYGFKDIKMFRYSESIIYHWRVIQENLFALSLKKLKFQQMQINGSSLIVEVQSMSILFICLSAYSRGNMTLGMVFSIQYVVGQLSGPLMQFGDLINGFKSARLGYDRLLLMYRQKIEDEDSFEDSNRIVLTNFDLKLSKVDFTYNIGDRKILNVSNIYIKEGSLVAFVGSSGSGKSTLFKLLLKYYELEKGSIFIGGVDYIDLTCDRVRDCFSIVSQDGYLFEDSIKRNIVLGNDYDDSRFKEVLKVSNLEDFVEQLPFREETRIGSETNKLSSGQKQRVLLARCLYKKAKIYLFDEATNFLDTINENQIIEKVRVFLRDSTVIVIAHRLSTVRNSDIIYVLESGIIIEEGNHLSLIANRSHYYELVKEQIQIDGKG